MSLSLLISGAIRVDVRIRKHLLNTNTIIKTLVDRMASNDSFHLVIFSLIAWQSRHIVDLETVIYNRNRRRVYRNRNHKETNKHDIRVSDTGCFRQWLDCTSSSDRNNKMFFTASFSRCLCSSVFGWTN